MPNYPMKANSENVFQSRKGNYTLPYFEDSKEGNRCEECEENLAIVFCKNCEEYLCKGCDLKIHNKGRRSEHIKEEINSGIERPSRIAFISFSTALKAIQLSCTDSELGKKLLAFIQSVLDKNEIAQDTTMIYVYYTSDDQLSQDLIAQICGCLESLKYYTFMNINEIRNLKQIQDISLKIGPKATDNEVMELAKCLSLISRGYQRIYICDSISSYKLGRLILSQEIDENQRIFTLEENCNTQTDNAMKMIELTSFKKASSLSSLGNEDYSDGSYFNSMNDLKAPQSISGTTQLTNNFGLVLHPRKEVEIDGSLELCHCITNEFRKLALQGELMITKEDFAGLIQEVVASKFDMKSEIAIEKASQVGIVRMFSRKYPDGRTVDYVSLQTETITIESLGWVCRSIKRDAMTPTEKLILSRIKECYDLKLEADYWNALLVCLEGNYLSAKKNVIDESTVILPLIVSNTSDPSTGADARVVYIKGEEWACEDIGTIDETSQSWRTFLKFLDDFFREDEDKLPKAEQKTFYTSNHRHSKYGNKYVGYQKYDWKVEEHQDGKAVPGGRYGCAQFVKVCGPELLQRESLGKLNLYVQEAINKGIVRYQRTLLVKNPQINILEGIQNLTGQIDGITDPVTEKKMRQLKKIKNGLIELLVEHPEGLSLAQIPQYLRRKLNFSFNLQEMGFPKLKNLLITMTEDIQIEVLGTNHSYASLKHPEKYAHLTKKFGNKHFHGYRNQDEQLNLFGFKKGHKSSHYPNLKSPERGYNNMMSPLEPRNIMKKANHSHKEAYNMNGNAQHMYQNNYDSTFDQYLQQIRLAVQNIISQIPSGISIDDLLSQLNFELGWLVDFNYFQCDNFYQFLSGYAADLVDIQISVDLQKQLTSYMVYPRFMVGDTATMKTTQLQIPLQQQIPSTNVPLRIDFVSESTELTNQTVLNKASETTEKYQPAIALYGNQPFQIDETPTSNRNLATEDGTPTPQNFQSANFRFIEKLLCENSPAGARLFTKVADAQNKLSQYATHDSFNALNNLINSNEALGRLPPGLETNNKSKV